MDLEVVPLGENGEVVLEPISGKNILSTSKLPCGLPPILEDTKSLLNSILDSPEKLPILHLDAVQRLLPLKPNISALYDIDVCPLPTQLTVKRDMMTGKLLGFTEEMLPESKGTHTTSTSLSRAPGPPDAGLRGSSSSFPFWPGGMDEPLAQLLTRDTTNFSLFEEEFLHIPPGFQTGMKFERKVYDSAPQKVKLSDVLSADDYADHFLADSPEPENEMNLLKTQVQEEKSNEETEIEDEFLKFESFPVLKISEADMKKPSTSYEWAVIVDVNKPVEDFNRKVPTMARTFEYTLDPFQAQAILHLEKKESVLVAAHTSAGKTTVADYAIALAQKHITRVIYTSPIKALSNQKYANFKALYKDVGLITGDVQINPTAFCLVMTTEILRSMLYRGSDVIRELEWVIFDEVHYINDSDRGVVWEEVFIMLPDHVNLIMLSATVPNAAEFADWIGGIKKRKIYVLSTAKRPVPLKHYLYTGNIKGEKAKSKNEEEVFFPIVDASGNFLTSGYNEALNSIKGKDNKSKSGPKGGRYTITPAQEKNIYIDLLSKLKKKNLLPTVVFTFSRKRCNSHAMLLKSQDYTDDIKEQSLIERKFLSWIETLKPEDRVLPQVLMMKEHLKRGIGVHHSGILPILKEIIEKLFDKGHVKVLFATETFAMGVNMPTRTVVFDSVRKHDGVEFRDLNPSEYTQMAGRAGRRDKDTSGTVVVLCKGEVPEASSLSKMMRGKPTELKSQFKLTYTMILNLLKVRTFRVEDVIRRSFGELDNQRKMQEYKDLLLQKECERDNLHRLNCSVCEKDIRSYYEHLRKTRELKAEVMDKKCQQALTSKLLVPGRLLAISPANIPGILLTIDKEKKCQVLCVANRPSDHGKLSPWSRRLLLPSERKPYLVTTTLEDIEIIGNKVLKMDTTTIVRECKREQAGGGPGHCSCAAILELCGMCEGGRLPSANISLKDIDFADKLGNLEVMEAALDRFVCTKCPDFLAHFSQFSDQAEVEDLIKSCKYKLSEESLELHPEYQYRKNVLKQLGFIDANETVQLKGSVAREMSNHELLITELLIRSIFNDCMPEDVAALLSCMVFESKCDDSNLQLPSHIQQKIKDIKTTAIEISNVQLHNSIHDPNFVSQYNFYLAPVVYEWAKGTSFSEIMQCTDVDEGIIVRSIQRLNELLKDVRTGANLVGDTALAKKMENAAHAIRRNIVFAASLYTQDAK